MQWIAEGKLRRFEQLVCPADPIQVNAAPVGSKDYYGGLSYGINQDICGITVDTASKTWKDGHPARGNRLKGQLDKVYQPSGAAVFTDGGLDQLKDEWVDKPARQFVGPVGLATTTHGPLLEYMDPNNAMDRLPAARHRGGSVNITYVDGHGGFAKKVPNPRKVSSNPLSRPRGRTTRISRRPACRLTRTGFYPANQ